MVSPVQTTTRNSGSRSSGAVVLVSDPCAAEARDSHRTVIAADVLPVLSVGPEDPNAGKIERGMSNLWCGSRHSGKADRKSRDRTGLSAPLEGSAELVARVGRDLTRQSQRMLIVVRHEFGEQVEAMVKLQETKLRTR